MLDKFNMVELEIEGMRSVRLSDEAQQAFAESALLLKYEEPALAPIAASKLLTAKRAEDTATDLWTTMNKTQENLLRGGIAGRIRQGRKTTTRAVTGVDGNVALNRALWALANKMRELVK